MRRRALMWGPLSALLIPAGEAWLSGATGPRKALVVSTEGVPAYEEAAEALLAKLRGGAYDVDRAESAETSRVEELALSSNIVVALGVGALRVAASRTDKPIVAAMCLRSQLESASDRLGPSQSLAAVTLDLPMSHVAREVRRLFPQVRRLGVLRRNGTGEPTEALSSAVAASGLSLYLAECAGPAELVEAFLSMRPHADIVYCPADELLFTAATVKPLILASLKNRLAVVGFSSGIVRAGAAAGVLPDFLAIGAKAGELAMAAPRPDASRRWEPCPGYRVALNRRVLRIVGLKHAALRDGDGIEVVG